MDAKVVAGALFDGSVIALVAAAATVSLDLFGFLNLMLPGAFVFGAAGAYAFAAAASPEWQRLAGGALVGAIAGFALDWLALDPLRRRRRTELMLIATLGCSLIAFGIIRAAINVNSAVMPRSLLAERVATVAHFTFSELDVAAVTICVLACTALHVAVYRTRFGAGVRAAIENPSAAQLMGMRVERVPPSAMAAICALAGVAGALSAMQAGPLAAGMPAVILVTALAACALAPIGSISIAAAIAFALTLVDLAIEARFPALPQHSVAALMLIVTIAGVALHRRPTPAGERLQT